MASNSSRICRNEGFLDSKLKSFNPKLPEQWNSYSFNINYREHALKVIVEQENIFIENMSEEQVELVVYGESYKIEDKLTIKREENLYLNM